jgi:hypothetical protein
MILTIIIIIIIHKFITRTKVGAEALNQRRGPPYESRYQHYLGAITRLQFQEVPELVGVLVLTLEKAAGQQRGKVMCYGLLLLENSKYHGFIALTCYLNHMNILSN